MERVSGESQEGLRIACHKKFNASLGADVYIRLVLAHVLNDMYSTFL